MTPPPIAQPLLSGLFDWPRDEAAHDGVPWEIWWVTAIVEAGGRRLAAHLLATHLAGGAAYASASLTDLADGADLGRRERLFAPGELALPRDRLAFAAGDIAFAGSFADGYRLRAELGEGCGIDLTLTPTRPLLLNGGAGRHRFQGVTTIQYSVAALDVRGSVRIGGAALPAAGHGWYDRQWEEEPRGAPLSFTWFGLCLDGGDVLGLFDLRGAGGSGQQWGTVLRPDGTHLIVGFDAAAGGAAASARGRPVARDWTIAIPALDAVLTAGQTRIADDPLIYTGVLDVAGRYRGAASRGYGFVDVVGPIGAG